MYDPKTKSERQWSLPIALKSVGGFVYGVEVAPDGTVWFSEPFGNYIGRFDQATETIKQWEVPAPGYGPRRLRTDSKGNVWLPLVSGHLGVFEPENGAVQVFRHAWPEETVASRQHRLPLQPLRGQDRKRGQA